MKPLIAVAAFAALSACAVDVPQYQAEIGREVETGRALMLRCQETGDVDNCAAYYAFKSDWEMRQDFPITFEQGLRNYDRWLASR